MARVYLEGTTNPLSAPIRPCFTRHWHYNGEEGRTGREMRPMWLPAQTPALSPLPDEPVL